MEDKQVKGGSIIFREGEPADAAYILRSGRVELLELSRGRETQIAVIEPGQPFGEMGIFDPLSLRKITARALEDITAQRISPEEFNTMLAQCPENIQPFLRICIDKTKAPKVKNTEATKNAVLENGVSVLTIEPANDMMKSQFNTMEIPITRLPFRIGGYPDTEESNRRSDQLHLGIACQANPLKVSRQHCEIIIEGNELMVLDLASRFCTIVNGIILGRGHGIYSKSLQKGKNEIILGAADSPYRLNVICG